MFERVTAFAIDNVGSPFSARRIADFMKSQRRSIRHETVLNHLTALTEAFVIARVPRYDLRGRPLLATTIAASEETRRREYAPLEAIADNHPKYVVTLDPAHGDDNSGGIRRLRVPDFLLSDVY